MKKQQKKAKGKNKFIRLDEDNLKFVVAQSKKQKRSQNNFINFLITQERLNANSNGK